MFVLASVCLPKHGNAWKKHQKLLIRLLLGRPTTTSAIMASMNRFQSQDPSNLSFLPSMEVNLMLWLIFKNRNLTFTDKKNLISKRSFKFFFARNNLKRKNKFVLHNGRHCRTLRGTWVWIQAQEKGSDHRQGFLNRKQHPWVAQQQCELNKTLPVHYL